MEGALRVGERERDREVDGGGAEGGLGGEGRRIRRWGRGSTTRGWASCSPPATCRHPSPPPNKKKTHAGQLCDGDERVL